MSKNAEEIWKDIPGYEGKYQASTLIEIYLHVVEVREKLLEDINGGINNVKKY